MKEFKYKGFSSSELYSTVREKFVMETRELHEDENLINGSTYIYKPIRISKVSKITNKIVSFKKLDLDYFNRWLLNNKDYELLEIEGNVYKAIFFPANDIYTMNADKGYVDLKVRLYKNSLSNICVCEKVLTNRIIDNIKDNEKIININNISSVEGLTIYPNFKISNMGRKDFNLATIIEIENTSISNNKLIIDLDENEQIYINGKNNYMQTNKDKKVIKTGEFIKLNQGINNILLKSDGYCKVEIAYQQEFNIEGVWDLE